MGRRARAALVSVICATTLLVSLGVAVPSASAGQSAFCTTIFTYHPTTPTGTTVSSYHSWAKSVLPFYQKLASNAPNSASKKTLNQVVTIVKYYANSGSLTKLEAYEATHRSQWLAGTKALAAAIESCAKSM
jgi:hypothetical protein